MKHYRFLASIKAPKTKRSLKHQLHKQSRKIKFVEYDSTNALEALGFICFEQIIDIECIELHPMKGSRDQGTLAWWF